MQNRLTQSASLITYKAWSMPFLLSVGNAIRYAIPFFNFYLLQIRTLHLSSTYLYSFIQDAVIELSEHGIVLVVEESSCVQAKVYLQKEVLFLDIHNMIVNYTMVTVREQSNVSSILLAEKQCKKFRMGHFLMHSHKKFTNTFWQQLYVRTGPLYTYNVELLSSFFLSVAFCQI